MFTQPYCLLRFNAVQRPTYEPFSLIHSFLNLLSSLHILIWLVSMLVLTKIYEFNNVIVEIEKKWDYTRKEKYSIKRKCYLKIFDNERRLRSYNYRNWIIRQIIVFEFYELSARNAGIFAEIYWELDFYFFLILFKTFFLYTYIINTIVDFRVYTIKYPCLFYIMIICFKTKKK